MQTQAILENDKPQQAKETWSKPEIILLSITQETQANLSATNNDGGGYS